MKHVPTTPKRTSLSGLQHRRLGRAPQRVEADLSPVFSQMLVHILYLARINGAFGFARVDPGVPDNSGIVPYIRVINQHSPTGHLRPFKSWHPPGPTWLSSGSATDRPTAARDGPKP